MSAAAFRLLAFVALATGAAALWVGLLRTTDSTVTVAPALPAVGSQSIFVPSATVPPATRPTARSHPTTTPQPSGSAPPSTEATSTSLASGLTVRGLYTGSACPDCAVRLGSGGVVRADVPAGSGRRKAYALLDLGSRAADGRVLAHDVIGLGRGQTPTQPLPVLQMLDASHRIIFELIAQPNRELYLYSPAGGLRGRALTLATGATVPNDGISGVAVDVSAQANGSVVVYVNGLRTASLAQLTGATTTAPRFLATGVIQYDTPSSAAALTTTHAQVSVSTVSDTTPAGPAPSNASTPTPPSSPTLDVVAPPTISGSGIVGNTLIAAPGSWTVAGATFDYAWQRCDGAGTCAPIDGAHAKAYTLVGADRGTFVRVRITAHAGTATAAKSSAAVGPVMRAAPTATTPPEAIGDAVVGEQLTADPGLWSDQSATFSYTWQRCDATGICTTIDGATDSTYTVVADDLGQRLRVEVTATNTGGTNTTDSVPTTIVVPAPPSVVTAPSVTGDATVGSTLTADPGSWSDPSATFAYAWQRCDDSGACTPINSADAATYTLGEADLNLQIRVEVTATNAGGTGTADAAATAPVTRPVPASVPVPPTANSAPSIGGDATVGSTLTADPGSWSDPSATFAYAWQRCDDSGACTPIDSAAAATYTLGEADLNLQIRVEVTATGVAGTTGVADSGLVGPVVLPPAPAVVAAPSIIGGATVGSTLTARPGSWSGPPPTFAYAWQRCDTTGACTPIDGATTSSYVSGGDDLDRTLRVEVTATNAGGTGSADSVATAPVALPPPPSVVTVPSVSGDPVVGTTLTADAGSWSGPPPTVAYAWQRCDTTGACTPIDGATSTTYALDSEDVGRRIRVEVTATNAGGARTTDSNPVGPVTLPPPPSVVTPPSVSGDATVGSTLTANPGSWSDPSATLSYAWQRCDESGVCSGISQATGSTHTVATVDVGQRIRVEVTATNPGGASSADSAATASITLPAPPSVATPPSLSGDATVGSTLTANPGSWNGPPPTFAYVWRRCDGAGACTTIDGATGTSYTPTAGDAGLQIAVQVTATNAGGAGTATSAPTAPIAAPPPAAGSAGP